MAKDRNSVSVATGAQQACREQRLLGAQTGKCAPGQAEDERRNCGSGHLCQAQLSRNIDRGTPLFHSVCQPGSDGLNGEDAPGGRGHVGAQFSQRRGTVGVPEHIGVGPAEVGDAYGHTAVRDFGSQGMRERLYAGLGGAAGAHRGRGRDRCQRSDLKVVADALHQVRQESPRRLGAADQVYVDHATPCRGVRQGEGAAFGDSRVRHNDRRRAQTLTDDFTALSAIDVEA